MGGRGGGMTSLLKTARGEESSVHTPCAARRTEEGGHRGGGMLGTRPPPARLHVALNPLAAHNEEPREVTGIN